MIVNRDDRWEVLMGVWKKGDEQIWFLFYLDSMIESCLKANRR